MKLALGSDRKKTPDLYDFRPMTLDEIKALQSGERVWFRSTDGRARELKINGAVKRWKRDPDRVEVPVKYGLYEMGRFDTDEALAKLLVRVESNPARGPRRATGQSYRTGRKLAHNPAPMNPLHVYEDAGRKAGRAMRNHDAGLFRHWSEWKDRALRLESEPYRSQARAAFDAAYSEYRRDIAHNPSSKRTDFLGYLAGVTADLRESGHEATADDLYEATYVLQYGRLPARSNFDSLAHFKSYLRDTLIPDLKASGRTETAKDFASALRQMTRTNPVAKKRNPKIHLASKRVKLYRVVAVKKRAPKSERRIYYLMSDFKRLDTSKTAAAVWSHENMARHTAEHLAMRYPAYQWGIERP